MNLLKAISTIGGYTMLSRIFGFVRDILIAAGLGAGSIADAFFVAFRFPNLFRRVFAEGAFASAFVPIFSGILEQEGRQKAHAFAEQAFAVLFLILAVFVFILELLMPWALLVLAPGFDSVPNKMEMATELSRIAFPYLLFISLVSLQSGVLNSLGRFAAAGAAPVLFNLVLIAALLGFSDCLETPGHVLSWAISIAGLIQFIWLVWHCRSAGFPLRLRRPRLTAKVIVLGQRVLPVIFGSSLYQINLLIGTILATLVADGAVSYLYYADRVTQLPLGVVGVAVGTALLPTLSRQLAAGDMKAANFSQNRGLEFALFLVVPATAALLVLAQPIVHTLFERGAFGPAETKATADALMAYSIGLPAYVLIRVLTPGFFAREDTKTPVQIAAASMGVNIILNLILMQLWGHVGLALAASIAAWTNAIVLAMVLRKRGELIMDKRLRSGLPRIVLASAGMAIGLFFAKFTLIDSCKWSCDFQDSSLVFFVIGGLALYGGLAKIMGVVRWEDFNWLRGEANSD